MVRIREPRPAGRWALSIWPLLAATATGLACGDDPSGPAQPAGYASAHFTVTDEARLSAALVDSLLARLEADYVSVSAFLPGFPAPDSIAVRILPGWDLPSATIGSPEITHYAENLTFDYNVHLLVHVFTGYTTSQFLEEGLAVYATEALVATSRTVEPYRGQVPHAWMSLYGQYGTVIPFAVVYSATNVVYEPAGSFVDASAWQLFVHAGSFARWVVDVHGAETWFALHAGGDPEVLLRLSMPAIEALWLTAARELYPDPLPCAVALGTVGQREEFWCALAEGRSSPSR